MTHGTATEAAVLKPEEIDRGTVTAWEFYSIALLSVLDTTLAGCYLFRTPDDDETDEAIEDKPPVQIKTSPEQVQPKAVVNSTISVVDDALAKRLGKRPAHGRLSCKDFNGKKVVLNLSLE